MKLKSIKLIAIALASLIGIATLSPAPLVAAEDVCSSGAAQSVKEAAGCNSTGDKLPGVIQTILNAVIGVGGTVAAVFIVIGGINYITSSGDPGKVKKAKDTIIYAAIGLVVAALAYAIVNWVIISALHQT